MAANRDKKVKQTVVLFVVTFLISLIVITYFIKSFSPNVDVEIGGDESQKIESENTDSDVKQAIDDRLRWIQMEDNLPGASKRDENDSTPNDITYESEKVRHNVDTKGTSSDKAKDKLAPIELQTTTKHSGTALPPPVPANPTPQAEPPKMSKVYVGSYSTIEQAIQAQNKLMNTSVSVSPFVKEVNGSYVLQVGSYTNAGKAEAVMREINSLGFSARVVKE